MCFSYLLVHCHVLWVLPVHIIHLSTYGTPNCESTLTISSMGDKSLTLLVRQVENTQLEIIFYEHLESMEEPLEVLLWLVLTRTNITGPHILPTAITHILRVLGVYLGLNCSWLEFSFLVIWKQMQWWFFCPF